MPYYIDIVHVDSYSESTADCVVAFISKNTGLRELGEKVTWADSLLDLMTSSEMNSIEDLDSSHPDLLNPLLKELRQCSVVFVYHEQKVRTLLDELKEYLMGILEKEDEACRSADLASPVCGIGWNDEQL